MCCFQLISQYGKQTFIMMLLLEKRIIIFLIAVSNYLLMIKSPEKEYNTYRILKVLSNQDFLATDFRQHFYILSAVEKRDQPTPAISFIHQYQVQKEVRIIAARECIQIDHMYYYVFSVGRNEVVCANAIDSLKLLSKGHLLPFFAASIRGILKFLLMRPLKDCKKYLDIRNFIVVKGLLYLLELDRGKKQPRSLEKSERLPTNQKDSLQKQLGNQLEIIKCFGRALREILFKPSLVSGSQTVSLGSVLDILKGMIDKELTFEYLDMKLGELCAEISRSSERRHRKIHFNLKNGYDSRYQTEPFCSNNKHMIGRISTEPNAKDSPQRYRPQIEKRKNMVSEIKTGNQLSPRIPRRFVSSINSNYSDFSSNAGTNSVFRDALGRLKTKRLEPLIPTKLRQKLIKQSLSAQMRFSKITESNRGVRSNRDEEITQNLREKLISRIKRIKTQTKNYETVRENYSNLSHPRLQICQTICKRLEFAQAEEHAKPTAKNIYQLQSSALEVPANQMNDKEDRVDFAPQQNRQKIVFGQAESRQKSQEQIDFEVIELPQEVSTQAKLLQGSNLMRSDFQTAENDLNHETSTQAQKLSIHYQYALDEQKIKTTPLSKKMINKVPQNVNTEEIQVIKFEKKEFELAVVSKADPKLIKNNSNRDFKQEKADGSVKNAVEQFEGLVNKLGDVARKSIERSKQLEKVQWYRATYFIYERYVYEREKFSEALTLGAKEITRAHRQLKQEQWILWLSSDQRKDMIKRVEAQNKETKKKFEQFVTRILQQFKFQRKVEYYIRNREKYYSNFAAKVRSLLSQFAVKYTIQTYDMILQKKMGRNLQIFVSDCLFAMLVIAEMDGLLQQTQKILLKKFERYSSDIERMDEIVQCLYSLYFQERSK